MSIDQLNRKIITLWNKGDLEEAIATGQDAAELAEKTYGLRHPRFATSLKNLGELYIARCDFRQAETFLTKAFDIEKEALGLQHEDTLQTMKELGNLYISLRSYGQAEEYFLIVLEALRDKSTSDKINLPEIHLGLGIVQLNRGLFENALESFHEGLRHLKQVDASLVDPEFEGSLHYNEGLVHLKRNRLDLAILALNRAYRVDQEKLEGDHPNFRRDLFTLADAYRLEGSYEKAKQALEAYIRLVQTACGEDQLEALSAIHHLAYIQMELGEYREAEQSIRRALEIAPKVLEKDSRQEAALLGTLADCLLKQGRNSDAAQYLHRSHDIMAHYAPTQR